MVFSARNRRVWIHARPTSLRGLSPSRRGTSRALASRSDTYAPKLSLVFRRGLLVENAALGWSWGLQASSEASNIRREAAVLPAVDLLQYHNQRLRSTPLSSMHFCCLKPPLPSETFALRASSIVGLLCRSSLPYLEARRSEMTQIRIDEAGRSAQLTVRLPAL